MNLHGFVEVILTEQGADALNCYNEQMNVTFAPMIAKSGRAMKTDYKEGDKHANIFWCLLDTFSKCFEDGKNLPFESIQIVETNNTKKKK